MGEKKTKGFVFTLDALFAMMITATMITAAYSFASSAQTDHLVEAQFAAFANDILVVLEKYGALDSLNENQIETALEQVLPDNYAAEIRIDSYRYQNEFSLEKTIIANYPDTADSSTAQDVVRARGNFLKFLDGKISRYNLIEIKLWLR